MSDDAAQVQPAPDFAPPEWVWPLCRALIYGAAAFLLLDRDGADRFGLASAVFFLALGGRFVRVVAGAVLIALIIMAALPANVLRAFAVVI